MEVILLTFACLVEKRCTTFSVQVPTKRKKVLFNELSSSKCETRLLTLQTEIFIIETQQNKSSFERNDCAIHQTNVLRNFQSWVI